MEGLERVEKLLALILVHDMRDAPLSDKAVALRSAGLGNGEIAEVLGSTAKSVGQQLYAVRKGGKRRKKSKGGES